MKSFRVFFILTLLVVGAASSRAQHNLQMDDGHGHVSILQGQTVDAGDIFMLPPGGGTLLTIPTPGLPSLVWQTAGNTLSAGQIFGSLNAFDVVMEANGVEKIRLVSGDGVKVSAQLTVNAGANGFKYVDGNQTAGWFLTEDVTGQASWANPATNLVTTATGTSPITVNGDNAAHSGPITIALNQGSLTTSTPSITVGGTGKTVGSNITVDLTTGVLTSTASTMTVTGTGKTVGANINADLNLGHANTWTAIQTFPLLSITNGELANSAITFNSTGSTLTSSGSVSLGGTANYDLNLNHANTWTAVQTFPLLSITNGELANSAITFNSTSSTLTASGSVSLGGTANYDLNLAHANTWTATQTLPITAAQGDALISSVNAGTTNIIDARIADNLTINGGTINNTPIGATTASTGTFTTINGTSLALTAKGTSASTVAGDAGTTLVTKDFVTTPGNVAVSTNATLVGNGTTGSPLGFNLANANTWTATQTLPVTAAQGDALISSVNAGTTNIIDARIADNLTINGGTINNTPIGATTASTGTFTTINGTSLALTAKGTSASTVAGDAGTTLVTKDFVTTPGNVAVSTNATLVGNGTTGSPLGFNLANANTWTATQTLPITAAQGDALISSVNAGTTNIIDARIADNLTINGGTINNTPIGATTASTGTFTTINGTSLALTAKGTSASTVAGDAGATLVTKDFVTTPGNVAVSTNATLVGNGTTATPLGLNVANPNTWTGTQTLGGEAHTPANSALGAGPVVADFALGAANSYYRISSTANVSLNGLQNGSAGRTVIMQNVGANTITLKSGAGAPAADGFDLPGGADIILGPKGAVTLIYDSTLSLWEVVSTN